MAHLVRRGRLNRVIALDTNGPFVEYVPNGLGWEGVFVDGAPVCIQDNRDWFGPLLSFRVGDRDARIEVAVNRRFRLRHFRLYIDDDLVYQEGGGHAVQEVVSSPLIPERQIPSGRRLFTARGLLILASVWLVVILLALWFDV